MRIVSTSSRSANEKHILYNIFSESTILCDTSCVKIFTEDWLPSSAIKAAVALSRATH